MQITVTVIRPTSTKTATKQATSSIPTEEGLEVMTKELVYSEKILTMIFS